MNFSEVRRGNSLLAVTLHNIKDFSDNTDRAALLISARWEKDENGNDVYFFQVPMTYDWVSSDAYKNFGT